MPSSGDIIPDDYDTQVARNEPPKPRSGFFAKSTPKYKSGDVIPDDVAKDMEGSVFDTSAMARSRKETAFKEGVSARVGELAGFAELSPINRLKALGKSVLPVAAGAAPIIGAEMAGPEGMLAGTAVKGAAGIASTQVQHEVSKFLGNPEDTPEAADYAKNAAINMGFHLLELPTPGVKTGAKSMMEGRMAENQVNLQNIKASLLNKDILKQSGMSDAQADDMLGRINKDPKILDVVAKDAATIQDAKQLYVDINRTIRGNFSNKFEALPYQKAPASEQQVADFGDEAIKLSRDPNNDRAVAYIKDKLAGLNKEPVTAIPADEESRIQKSVSKDTPGREAYIERLRQAYVKSTGKPATTAAPAFTLSDVRQLITDARYAKPNSLNPQEQRVWDTWTNRLRQTYDAGMKSAGASDQDILDAKELYHQYGAADATLKAVDPLDPRFGSKVADAMFGEPYKDPSVGIRMAAMVEEVDKVRPNTMNQFRQGVLQHMTDEAKLNAAGSPMTRLQNLAKIQRKVAEYSTGGQDQGRSFLRAVFGDGPMADPKTFAQVTLGVTDPELPQKSISAFKRAMQSAGSAPMMGWAIRMAGIAGIAYGVTGKAESPFRSLMNPQTAIYVIPTWLVGGAAAQKFLGAGGAVQKAYVNYVLNPAPESLQGLMNATTKYLPSATGATLAGIAQTQRLNQEETNPTQAVIP